MFRPAHKFRAFALLTMAFTLVNPAWAFFGDDEARKAIIELRQLVEEHRRVNAEGAAVTRRSILDVSTQAEQWRQELGQLRGQQEQLLQENQQLLKTVADLKAQLSALDARLSAVDGRIKTFEPVSIEQDGVTLLVSPPEKAAFDRAMALLLASDFTQAAAAYVQLLNQYPNSAYTASVLYWLGNAQYASQDLKGSINTHKRLVVQFPRHSRVAEALLSIGNAHAELGDAKSARSEWDSLIANHPKSEAASTARERLKTLPRQ
jgi:tol-pal system protein YbgF